MERMEFPDAVYEDTWLSSDEWGGESSVLFSVFRDGDFYSTVLGRPTVEVLRDWLTIWLEEER